MKCRILRRISTEVRNAKTLTIVVRERCLARRRDPTRPIDVQKFVFEIPCKWLQIGYALIEARNVAQV